MAKGGSFERLVCYQLSLWWTRNEKESVFWRTSQSGGRATTREKSGKKTSNHYGDICSTSPCSSSFNRVVIAEMKKGYRAVHLSDLLDLETRGAKTPNQRLLEEWIIKNEDACRLSGVRYWLIVHGRSGRVPFIYFSDMLYRRLRPLGTFHKQMEPFIRASIKVRSKDKARQKRIEICGMRFDDWLYHVCPKDFKILAKRIKREDRKSREHR